MTFHVPKQALWALGFLVVAGAVAAAFLIGRSSGDEETSGGTSDGSEPAGTTEPAAVEAPCTEEAAQRATLDSDFDDAIIETAAAQSALSGFPPARQPVNFKEVGGYRASQSLNVKTSPATGSTR